MTKNQYPIGLAPYLTDEIGYCDVVEVSCFSHGLKCKRTQLGTEYRGDKSTTKSGRRCSSWKNRMIAFDPSISEAKNHCRNPDGDIGGPWCYVDDHADNEETWESCGIEWCDNSYNVNADFR